MAMKESKTIRATVANLVKVLAPRNRDIITRRFGLQTGERETLESIGQSYSITRERVRQIEEFTKTHLIKAIVESKDVANYANTISKFLSSEGGIASERRLFQEFSGNHNPSVANASLSFLLTMAGGLVHSEDNDRFESFWALSKKHADDFRSAADRLTEIFSKHGKPVAVASLASFVTSNGASYSAQYLDTILAISKDTGRNIFGEVGLVSWAEVSPKGVRDKAYLVMQREGKPQHFTNIAKLIAQARFDDAKRVNIQTVHNELIKDKRFVLVGRGMYGLSEWGYKPGTVKDVLVDILKSSRQPITKADLVAKVLNVRMVKENTILLNLQDSSSFTKNDDGTYEVRKA